MAAALLLLLVVTGPPTLLLLLTGNPVRVPDSLRSLGALSHPVQDHTLLWILATVGWLAWLRLLACLVLEAAEQLRGATIGLPLPGLLLGADRLLAARLIGALLLTPHAVQAAQLTPAPVPATTATTLLTAGSAAPTHSSPIPAALVTPSPAGSALSAPSTVSAAGAQAQRVARNPIACRVLPPQGRRHDTLWDIAVRHLGDGMRWREIYALNAGRVMPDGQRLTRASLILPGWVLLLPDDATLLTVDQVPTNPGALDTGSSAPGAGDGAHARNPLAPTQSGEADPQHAALGPHAPGVRTSVPAARHAGPTPPDAAARSSIGTGRADDPAAAPPVTGSAAESVPASPPDVEPNPGSRPEPLTGSPAGSQPDSQPGSRPAPHEQHALTAVTLATLGSSLLAASALLAALTRRRKLAARRRPPGVRHTRPAPALLEAERRLRRQAHRADDIGATIRLALLIAAGAEPPVRVRAVWEHPDGTLDLILTPPSTDAGPDAGTHAAAVRPCPPPFEPTAHGWRLTPEGQRYLFAVRTGGQRRQDRTARLETLLNSTADPFPVLLPVGTRHGSACLVNLEQFGLITLDPAHDALVSEGTAAEGSAVATGDAQNPSGTGDTVGGPAAVEAVLAAWAQALAGAPWAELTHLYLPTEWEHVATGLRQVSTVDLLTAGHPSAGPGPGAAWQLAAAVDGQGGGQEKTAPDLETARRAGVAGADSVRVNVSIGFRADQVPSWLPAAAADPRDPNVLLLAGPPARPHPGAHRWQLNDDGTVDIPGIADHLTPLRLDPDEHQLQLRLLEHAEDPPHADPGDPQREALLAQSGPLPARAADCAVTPPAPPAGGPVVIDLTEPSPSRPTAALGSPADTAGPTPAPEPDGEAAAVAGPAEPSLTHLPEQTVEDGPDLTAARDEQTVTSPRETAGAGHAHRVRTAEVVAAELVVAPREPASEEPGLPLGPVEVCVLGPVEVHGTAERLPRKQAVDVLVYLAMHRRPVPADVLFEAVWPNSAFNGRTLRNRVSEVRAYIAPGVDHPRGGYQLPDLVLTDWQRFQTLAKGDTSSQIAALQLVRGRPFEGSTLDWIHLEGHYAEMEAAIVDLALHVGDRALREQAYDAARDAVYAGLRGCPYEERLYRIAMESAAARGATAELRELRRRLDLVLAEEVDDDVQPATEELYQRLSDDDELLRRRQERRA